MNRNDPSLAKLTPSDRIHACLGEKATVIIQDVFGDVETFNQLVEQIRNITHPTSEIVGEIDAYFDQMGYSEYPENRVMLFRLDAIVENELTPEQVDIDFMQHELLERSLVERGIPKGYIEIPNSPLVWDAAHDITSQALGVESADSLYHLDALRAADETIGGLEI